MRLHFTLVLEGCPWASSAIVCQARRTHLANLLPRHATHVLCYSPAVGCMITMALRRQHPPPCYPVLLRPQPPAVLPCPTERTSSYIPSMLRYVAPGAVSIKVLPRVVEFFFLA